MGLGSGKNVVEQNKRQTRHTIEALVIGHEKGATVQKCCCGVYSVRRFQADNESAKPRRFTNNRLCNRQQSSVFLLPDRFSLLQHEGIVQP